MTARLDARTLAGVDANAVAVPLYDRASLPVAIAHLGPGAFHRAHQNAFYDALNARDPRWGVCAVSMKTRTVVDALARQDGLYTLATLDRESAFRILGSIVAAHVAGDPELEARLVSPELRVLSMTVTEKGYCLKPDGALDFSHPDIAADLRAPERPVSAIGWIVRLLGLRRAQNLSPLTIVSCDNLPENGRKLRAAVLAFADAVDRELARWIEDECRFPSTMVDSITPASDAALYDRVRAAIGCDDAAAVQREAFASWVIEDDTLPGFPDLASVGATMTRDVALHETCKLRMLNGAHSFLAYTGLARGRATVAEAMRDEALSQAVERLLEEEIAPTLDARGDIDLTRYGRTILERFRNPMLDHRLAQIAQDGSQKLPIRLLGTMRDNLAADRPLASAALGIAAWMRHVRRAARANETLADPLAARLLAIGKACADEPADVALFLAEPSVFPRDLAGAERFTRALEDAYAAATRLETR